MLPKKPVAPSPAGDAAPFEGADVAPVEKGFQGEEGQGREQGLGSDRTYQEVYEVEDFFFFFL
jgi:hypothetical protein